MAKKQKPGRPAKQYSQAFRLLRIYELLRTRHHVTIPQLAEEFGTHRRTVQRDLNVLHDLYAIEAFEVTATQEKLWRLVSSQRVDALKLNPGELMALYMGRHLFGFMRGTDLGASMDSLYEKLDVRLAAGKEALKPSLPKKFYCTDGKPKSYKGKEDVTSDLIEALRREHKVRVRYAPPKRESYEDVLQPYTLVMHASALYLVAFSERANDLRVYAVERVTEATRLDGERFEYPQGYDPATFFDGAFGITRSDQAVDVVLRFDGRFGPYVRERKWHHTAKQRDLGGGALELAMKIAVNEELVHWITGYGGGVEVLEPASLRDAVVERHRAAVL